MIIDYTPQLPIGSIVTKKVCGYNSESYIGEYMIVDVFKSPMYRYTKCEPITFYRLKPINSKAKLDIANGYTFVGSLGYHVIDCISSDIIKVIGTSVGVK